YPRSKQLRYTLFPYTTLFRSEKTMDREQKATAVAELTEDLKGAEAIFAVDYRGISVTEAAELRGKLREADAVLKVVKNRLAKRADRKSTRLNSSHSQISYAVF